MFLYPHLKVWYSVFQYRLQRTGVFFLSPEKKLTHIRIGRFQEPT